ncbi:MAG TPA: hypothetical protein VHX66_15760 [Solirubrobacteraceae bacterium]|jgi:hypothetical protein|nr:hypothetical protein [Solirubrobacteraceae bacterium]
MGHPRERSILDTYGLPHRLPVVFRLVLLILAVPAIGVVIWLLLPHSPAVVAILAVYVVLAIAGGLWRISTARELSRAPGRHPMPPPSTTPPSTS